MRFLLMMRKYRQRSRIRLRDLVLVLIVIYIWKYSFRVLEADTQIFGKARQALPDVFKTLKKNKITQITWPIKLMKNEKTNLALSI